MKFEVYQSLYKTSFIDIKTPLIACDTHLISKLLMKDLYLVQYPEMVKSIKKLWDFSCPEDMIVSKLCIGTSIAYSRKRVTKKYILKLLYNSFLPNSGAEHNQKLRHLLDIPKDDIIECMFSPSRNRVMETADIIILATLVNFGEI